MQIVIRLVGVKDGEPDNEVLRLESSAGKSAADQQTVYDYIKQNMPVLGLAYKLSGNGVITYSASASALRSDIISDMESVFQAALEQL